MSSESPDTANELIKTNFATLVQHIREYRAILNEESIWLLLTTMGCWGITNWILRFSALLITLAIFVSRGIGRIQDGRSIAEMIKDQKSQIDALLGDGDTKKARLYELLQFQQNELSTLNSLKTQWIFAVSWLFFIVTVWHTLGWLPPLLQKAS